MPSVRTKPVKIIVHFNKSKSKHDLPWTVHIRGKCIPAKEVYWTSAVELKTVWKPDKPSNPRGWIECKGNVEVQTDNVVIIRNH